jgi:hypothetical protein
MIRAGASMQARAQHSSRATQLASLSVKCCFVLLGYAEVNYKMEEGLTGNVSKERDLSAPLS